VFLGLGAALRIVADAAIYRVRKREGGNLVTSMSLAFALALPLGDIGYRLGFGVLLNLFVYLLNDCFDVQLDMAAPGRDSERTRFLYDHVAAGWASVGVLGVALALMGWLHSSGLLIAFVANALLIAAYSRQLKRWPVIDVVAMLGWGVAMGLVGFPIDSVDGWVFAGLLAILCGATEAVQVMRDADSDREAGLRTTAVVFGTQRTAWIARGLIFAAGLYSCLLIHRFVGLAFWVALFVPLDRKDVSRSWDQLRLVFGPSWLALLAFYRFGGGFSGLLRTWTG